MLTFVYQLKTNNMTVEETFKLANELKNKFPELSNWRVSFHNKKNALGTCKYSTREILISKVFLPYINDNGIKMTILHEIAHALTIGHGHDYYWRTKCISIGGDGLRLSNYDKFIGGKDGYIEYRASISKYTFSCPVCDHKTYKNRMPKRNFCCGLHGRVYDEKYKMVLVNN